ncbi:MAG: LOG family protein [Phycisphaeraceae bacterium]|nr:LOG family protein [Phycisphaerae bacterium]MBX3391986.1 LOG family protein [Phycisphaeraceae bacterium]
MTPESNARGDGTVERMERTAPSDSAHVRAAEDPQVLDLLDSLIGRVGGVPGTFKSKLVRDLMVAGLKLIPDGRDTGELKLMSSAVREMRYAYSVFSRYAETHKVTIFGSARTPEDHPDYAACVEFSRLMAEQGWMIITGAGGGIMHAGHVGPGREASFGVAIRLPFETNANKVIAGDEKLIHFRYFFTRKLMFISQAEAVALFPGGFGTLDEAYEALTLVQTGKTGIVPIVLVEGAGGDYWSSWDAWVGRQLLDRGWISPEDTSLYHLASSPREAVDHVARFYRTYHSSRYVDDDCVIRLKHPLRAEDIDRLTDEFRPIIREGSITQRGPYLEEDEWPQLPRLAFTHTRSRFGMVRRLIDRINECEPSAEPWVPPERS